MEQGEGGVEQGEGEGEAGRRGGAGRGSREKGEEGGIEASRVACIRTLVV